MTIRAFAPATKTVSFSAAPAVGNALVTTLPTAITPSVLTGMGLDGAQAGSPFPVPRTVSVTTASHSGSYSIGAPNAITVKGTDGNGKAVQDTLQLTATGGGETIKGLVAFRTVTEIDIPAQADALGSFTFGVYDVVPGSLSPTKAIRAGSSGNLVLTYADGSTDTLPCASGEQQFVQATAVSGSTSIAFTLYL